MVSERAVVKGWPVSTVVVPGRIVAVLLSRSESLLPLSC